MPLFFEVRATFFRGACHFKNNGDSIQTGAPEVWPGQSWPKNDARVPSPRTRRPAPLASPISKELHHGRIQFQKWLHHRRAQSQNGCVAMLPAPAPPSRRFWRVAMLPAGPVAMLPASRCFRRVQTDVRVRATLKM